MTNKKLFTTKKIFIFLIILSFAGTCYSQQDVHGQFGKNKLNGHVFLDYFQFSTPFILTSLKINVGAGSTSVITIPPIEIGEHETPAINGIIGFTNAELNYQQRFTPWLSLNIKTEFYSRYGTNVFSLLYDGLNTISGGKIGWKIKFIQTKKLILTSDIFVKNLKGNFINITDFVKDIIAADSTALLIKSTPVLYGGIGFSVAYAFNETWGIQAESQLLYGEAFNRNNKNITLINIILGEADFYPHYHIPLGVGVGYMYTSMPETVMENNSYTSVGFFKLAYTGAIDYELGLEYMIYKIRLFKDIKKPYVNHLSLSFKFYFN